MKSFSLTLTDTVIKPARVVKITRRDGSIIRMAEAQSSITVSAQTFPPVAGLVVSSVKHTLGGQMPSLEIQVVHTQGGTFDSHDINIGMFDGADVELYIVNRANPTTLGLMFSGIIGPITFNQSGEVNFDIRGHSAEASGVFVQTFSPMCRTDLFSDLCQLNPDDWDHTGTVGTIIDRFNFTVAGLASPPADGWFNGGVVETANNVQFRVGNWTQSSLRITAYLPCHNFLTVGEAITLWPGCAKTITVCDTKFDNAINFQGEPHYLGPASASAAGI